MYKIFYIKRKRRIEPLAFYFNRGDEEVWFRAKVWQRLSSIREVNVKLTDAEKRTIKKIAIDAMSRKTKELSDE